MTCRSTLLVIAAGVVVAALLYHDWWGGTIYLQDGFRDRAVGLTPEELQRLPGAGEPDWVAGDRWSYHRRTEDAAGRRATWVDVVFENGRVAEVHFR
jgi:hypothetical protein